MKRAIIAIVILIIIAGAAFYGYQLLVTKKDDDKKRDDQVEINKEVVVVEITPTGIAPATITVKKGAQVTFVNKDKKAHWIASDPHPSNDGLPGFDAEEGLAEGESYSFIFEKTGTFTFHDHLDALNKKFQGTIIVE